MTFGALKDFVKTAERVGVQSDSQVKIRFADGQKIAIKDCEIFKHNLFGTWYQLLINAEGTASK